MDGPGDDDVVVDGDEEGGHEHPEAEALHDGREAAEQPGGPGARVLSEGQLEEEEGESGEEEHDGVGEEEGAAAVLVSEEGEAPVDKNLTPWPLPVMAIIVNDTN